MDNWYCAAGPECWILRIHVQPGAKRTALAGLHGEALKIRLAAPPVEGKANVALIAFVARTLKIAKCQISIVAGETSRSKTLRIEGVGEQALGALRA